MIESADSNTYQLLEDAVCEIFVELAKSIISDAEGGTKFITVNVQEGETITCPVLKAIPIEIIVEIAEGEITIFIEKVNDETMSIKEGGSSINEK